jgi:hypothetical protein
MTTSEHWIPLQPREDEAGFDIPLIRYGQHSSVLISAGETAGWISESFRAWVDPQATDRRRVASAFARLARNIRGVQEVWLNETLPDLEVSVVMRESDLDRDLELRGIFIDLVCETLDPSVGELLIYTDSDAPEWTREGERLT